jgi:hypothetical protein
MSLNPFIIYLQGNYFIGIKTYYGQKIFNSDQLIIRNNYDMNNK